MTSLPAQRSHWPAISALSHVLLGSTSETLFLPTLNLEAARRFSGVLEPAPPTGTFTRPWLSRRSGRVRTISDGFTSESSVRQQRHQCLPRLTGHTRIRKVKVLGWVN